MWLMYAIAMGTSVADGGIGIGTFATDWTNDVLFGEIVPNALGGLLESIGVAGWLYGLIMDGIVAGVGAVLGFVPQMLVLFFLLSILEDVGYMARVAFIMDRIFRRFGLSGKSFIPILVGTGCGVPGVMASRTIEVLKIFREAEQKIEEIIVVGGGIKSVAWQQILADVYQERIRIPKLLDEATSMGAAITGGVGVGLFADFSVVDKFVSIARDVHPNPDNAEKYDALQDAFEEAYQALVPVYEQLHRFCKS